MALQVHLEEAPRKGNVPAGPGHKMGVRVQGWTRALRGLCEPRLGGEGAGGEKVPKMSKIEATAESMLPQAERPLQSTDSLAFHWMRVESPAGLQPLTQRPCLPQPPQAAEKRKERARRHL